MLTLPANVHGSAGGLTVGLTWVSFSYYGWNAAVDVSGEVRDPERTLPRALLLGTGVASARYLALNVPFVFTAPWQSLPSQAEIARIAALALGGEG